MLCQYLNSPCPRHAALLSDAAYKHSRARDGKNASRPGARVVLRGKRPCLRLHAAGQAPRGSQPRPPVRTRDQGWPCGCWFWWGEPGRQLLDTTRQNPPGGKMGKAKRPGPWTITTMAFICQPCFCAMLAETRKEGATQEHVEGGTGATRQG